MTFPALIPSSRIFTPGDYANTTFAGWSGQENRTRHSNVMLASALKISFLHITEAQLELIIDHYNSTLGTYLAFDVPSVVWAGVSNHTDYTLAGYSWRYTGPPSIQDLSCSIYNVELELQSVVPENASTSRRSWSAAVTWAVGSAIGLPPGAAQASGVDWLSVIGWSEQDINADVFGQIFEASATWSPGTALELSDVFNAVLYTGNAGTNSITGVGFEPGLVWTKRRTSASGDHAFYDYARSSTKYWRSSSTQAQVTDVNSLSAFNSDGFTLGNASISNATSASYVAWCIAKGGAGATNSDGSISTTVSANALAGFNIIAYTGTGANATIGHGLGSTPEFVIIKNLSITAQHAIVGNFLGTNQYLLGFGTGGFQTSSTVVQGYSNSTISLGSLNTVNGNGNSLVAYAFKSVTGTSKVGTYTGSGSADQTIDIGFQPQFILIKAYSATGDWMLFDSVRGVDKQILMQSSNVETTVDKLAFTSGGFTVKASQDTNTSSVSYVYLAFR